MMENNNLKALNLEQDLKQAIVQAELPISTVYYILKVIVAEVQDLFQQQVNKEAQEAKAAEAQSNEASEPAQSQEQQELPHAEGEIVNN